MKLEIFVSTRNFEVIAGQEMIINIVAAIYI